MSFPIRLSVLLIALLMPATLPAMAPPPAASTAPPADTATAVSVHYQDPETFSESRFAFGHRFNHDDYLGKLKDYLVRRAAPQLKPGQHLDITVTDIQLAGRYEPWHGTTMDHVRFMRDTYPPRMDLHFRLTAADGTLLREGTRKLRDVGYLHNSPVRINDTDPLRYDKALIDKWLRRGPDKW